MNEIVSKYTVFFKKPKFILILGLVGILFIFFSSFFSTSEKKEEIKPEITTEEYKQNLEKDIIKTVRQITGSKNVSVVITLESGIKYNYADTKEETLVEKQEKENKSSDSELKAGYITVKSSDGGEQALLVTTQMPEVRGVAIVCDGGDNEVIIEKIQNAVMAALDINSKRVYLWEEYIVKKGKVFGKGQLTVALMVIALGGAIWLNTKYLPSSTKYLGETSYVDNMSSGEVAQTSAKAETDYFAECKKDREKARQEAIELIEDTLDKDNLKEKDKKSALAKLEEIAGRIEQESNIETLLKAKDFKKAVAVINDTGVTVVVKGEGLTTGQTLQIQDIVTSETNVALANIKIVPVK